MNLLKINELWSLENEEIWLIALDSYWNLVKPSNLELEKKIDNLKVNDVREMGLDKFYEFLISDYFRWKYTDARWINRYIGHFSKYVEDEKLDELQNIKEQLFSFDLNNVELGLKVASQIKGLGIAGASGLLSILFPKYFATVDQFIVKTLRSIDEFSNNETLKDMNPENLTTKDGIMLINIMKYKAHKLNDTFGTDFWTPRKIDKILWATRNGFIKDFDKATDRQENSTGSKINNLSKISIHDYISDNSITSENKKILKSLFINYLNNEHPHINTVNTYFTDAIFILNNKSSLDRQNSFY